MASVLAGDGLQVCLSLLGTWSGGKGENWDPSTSTALQVLPKCSFDVTRPTCAVPSSKLVRSFLHKSPSLVDVPS